MLKHFRNIFQQLQSAELRLVAASLSFSTLLSLVPFIAVSLAILQSIGGMEAFTLKVHGFVLSNFKGILGEDGIFLLHKAIKRSASTRIGALGAILLVYTSARLIWDFDRAIHKVFGLKNTRALMTRFVQYGIILMTLPFILAGYVATRNAKSLDAVLTPIPSEVKVAMMLLIALIFAYKAIPCTKVKLSAAVIGACVGAGGLILLRAFFGSITQYTFYYSKLYGSIAAIPILMIWILNMWYIILFGAGLTAGLNKKAEADLP